MKNIFFKNYLNIKKYYFNKSRHILNLKKKKWNLVKWMELIGEMRK